MLMLKQYANMRFHQSIDIRQPLFLLYILCCFHGKINKRSDVLNAAFTISQEGNFTIKYYIT